jgi:bifunctional N-acetylglucosamine-1-phosphate-uridyltransferase/glucosamine-1-phosphate-acetyltransferase GlmU-like protein
MRTLIIPCAGKSSRFTTELPKWLLEHPTGNLMVYESIQGLPLETFDRIIVVALKRHLTDELVDLVTNQFKDMVNFELLLLENDTHSASDTVSRAISNKNIIGSIFIKDADDYFKIDNVNENEVCTYSLNDCTNITPGNKSYIRKNDTGEVLTIVEKSVISSDFCCGLYTFSDAKEFVDTYESIKQEGEIYISHVIFQMLLNGKTFFNRSTRNFMDWGTQEDWDSFIKKHK